MCNRLLKTACLLLMSLQCLSSCWAHGTPASPIIIASALSLLLTPVGGGGWSRTTFFFLLDTWTLSLLLHIDVFDPLFLSSFDFWSVRPSRCHCHYNWRRLSTASSFLIKHFVPAPKGAVLRLTACTMDFH